MTSRRPGPWTSGEETDDEKTGEPMASLQQSPAQGKAEASRPGSSGGWGTCAELLLVSAVKKHGALNWNSVALELKTRAILLNLPPQCFSEEACRFKYNVLKGKFASSSSSGLGRGEQDDLDGGVLFEELRKVRMSHLKEELQKYDSSIGLLQSRIRKLKEERSPQPVKPNALKLHDSSSVDLLSKSSKHSDLKETISRKSGELSDRTPGLQLKTFSQLDLLGEKMGSPSFDVGTRRRPSSSMSQDRHGLQRDPQLSSSSRAVVKDLIEELRSAGELAGENKPTSAQCNLGSSASEIELTANGNEQVSKDADQGLTNEPEQVREEPERKGWAAANLKSRQTSRAGNSLSKEKGRGESAIKSRDATSRKSEERDGVFRSVGSHSLSMEVKNTAETEPSSRNPAEGVATHVSDGRENDRSKNTKPVLDKNEERPNDDQIDSSIRPTETQSHPRPESLTGDLLTEVTEIRSDKIEPVSRKEPEVSKPATISYGRAARENRPKHRESLRLSGLETREAMENNSSQKAEGVGTQSIDGKDRSSHVPSEQRSEKSRSTPNGPVLAERKVENGSNEGVSAILVTSQAAVDKVVESRQSGDRMKPISSNASPNVDEPMAVSASSPDNRADHKSSPGGLQSLATSLALPTATNMHTGVPETDGNAVKPPLPVSFSELFSASRSKSSQQVQQAGPAEYKIAPTPEIPPKTKTPVSRKSFSAPEGERRKQASVKVTADVNVEGGSVKADQQPVKKIETREMDDDSVREQKLDPDLGRCRSLTDDVSHALCLKESEDAQEDSRDCLDNAELQQALMDYTDSQMEKSEVGSSMDSIEDMSPSSRKNRREPKVPGKFLPLLECLRVICAHKSAPLFKQRQEYQDNAQYDRLVRRHVDLGMVRTRLEEGAYSGSVEFFRDLLLIFTNALVYNNSDSQEYCGAKALRSCALVEMDKILQTEALLKQNGPATRKREVRKSMDMHKIRLSSGAGVEGRKKGMLKVSNESGTDAQGSTRTTAQVILEDSSNAGRLSGGNEEEREVDGRPETSKKPTPNRVTKDEPVRKESQKTELLIDAIRSSANATGKKAKVDSSGQISNPQVLKPEAGAAKEVENASSKAPAKMKDVMCIDAEIRNSPTDTQAGNHPRPPQPTKQGAVPKQFMTRVSRYSKRAGDTTASNPKKRIRR